MTHNLTTMVHEQIPLARAMQVEINQVDGWVITRAPLAPNQNHMGTAFAGSLGAICMLTGWAQVLATLGLDFSGDIVLKSADLRYLRPLDTSIEAQVVPIEAKTMDGFLSDFETHTKADLKLRVLVTTDEKKAVMYRGTYTAMKLQAKP